MPDTELSQEERRRRLGEWIATRRSTATAGSAIPVSDRTRPVVTSYGQRGMWFQEQLHGSGSRNLVFAWMLKGELDTAALFSAVDLIVARHEALRTAFEPVDGEPYQVVRPPFRQEPIVHRPPGADPVERAEALRQGLDDAGRRRFDLTSGRLLRCEIWELGPTTHTLVVAVPHIAFDGWSAGILFTELRTAYGALSQARTPELPDLVRQYPDYARWQRETGITAADEEWIDRWSEWMRGAPPILALPADRPRPAVSGGHTASVEFAVPAALMRRVADLADGHQATSFMVLLAAYHLMLSRVTGSSDVVVGTPVANRSRVETEPLIGYFVNTLAVRAEIGLHQPFRTLLQNVRQRLLEVMEHAVVPFDLLVERLNPVRVANANPLVQALFTLQNTDPGSFDLPGLSCEPYAVRDSDNELDLVFALVAAPGGGMNARAYYQSDLFDAVTVTRMTRQYLAILTAVTARPDVPVARLDLLGEEERKALAGLRTGQWRPAPQPPVDAGERIREHAVHHGARTAVVTDAGTLTFAELDERADALAVRLVRAGVGADLPVGVSLPRSPALAVALLAVWRAGGAFVPLDPGHPAARLAAVVADAGAIVVVAEDAQAVSGWWTGPVVPAEAMPPAAGDPPAEVALPSVPADCLAYVIHTSGTTGEPKGVGVTRGNLAAMAAQLGPIAGPGDGPGVNVLSPSFDGWIWSMVLPLAHGHGVVLADPLEGVERVLHRSGAESVTLTPSMLATCATLPETLRTVVVAGERCPPALLDRWAAGRRVINAYGPTETAICATWADGAAGEDVTTIGHPVPGYTAQVVDRYLLPVAIGVTGELCVGGPGVARGYLNRPGLTAGSFVPDPLSQEGTRMYRTGDVVRQRPDGVLEYVGRMDDQVKVRGFRVELAEIEEQARRVPGVADCTAYIADPRTGGVLGLALVADATGLGDDDALAPAVLAALTAVLPGHMVPGRVHVVTELPLLPTGKRDRAALAATSPAPADLSDDPPATPLEKQIADVWSEALQVPVDDVTENFFDLGGHSLVAARVVAEVRDQTGIDLSVRELMTRPTVRSFAAEIERLRAGDPAAAAPTENPEE